MVMGMTGSREFNAPNCAKWLAAIVVGDAGDYVFSREVTGTEMPEIAQGGDWTHGNQYPDWTLTITGSEAVETVLSLAEFESLREGVERAYCAASSGCYAINGAPMVYDTASEGYNGENAFGPVRLVVENTISAWVKNVAVIILGEEIVRRL